MAWFFSQTVTTPIHTVTGEDAQHIIKSLRMKVGEQLSICDGHQIQHDCIIESIGNGFADLRILNSYPCKNEPTTKVTLYQALTKGDKMDFIIQKSVELGVSKIVPVLSARCVSRPDEKSIKKKLDRWNKIALQAAMQSRRAIVPTVAPMMKFNDAAEEAGSSAVICYELGGVPLGNAVADVKDPVSLFIGSEGGFEKSEVDMVLKNGGCAATLGRRILRAETAPLAALSVVMYLTGNLGNEHDAPRTDNGLEIKGGNWHA